MSLNNEQEEAPLESLSASELQELISIKEDQKPKGKALTWKKEMNKLFKLYNEKFDQIYKLIK